MRRLLALALAGSLLAACNLSEHGPWVDESGYQVPNGLVMEFDGPASCEWGDVVFLRFFGAQYAKDPQGQLGTLTGSSGEALTFQVLDEAPPGAMPTGIRHQERQILLDDAQREDYLFVEVGPNSVEQWPRAEVTCPEMPGPVPTVAPDAGALPYGETKPSSST